MKDIREYISSNTYPGRGIILGCTPDGKNAVIAYFIMGRSVNSRNRIFAVHEEGIKTKAFDESKLTDPSLVIYTPVRMIDGRTIVTNGDQTDTIYDFIASGKTFEDALETREYEPDEPNFTPRISGIVILDGGLSYKLSILKHHGSTCRRFYFNYKGIPGTANIIHTYREDGDPIPSYEGEPVEISTYNDIDMFSEVLWDSLDNENKVSLFVRYINIENGGYKTKIFNKNGGL